MFESSRRTRTKKCDGTLKRKKKDNYENNRHHRDAEKRKQEIPRKIEHHSFECSNFQYYSEVTSKNWNSAEG